MPITISTIYEDDDLAVRRRSGGAPGGRLILAFTGVGRQMGGIQAEEFVRVGDEDADNVVFIVDKNRSWFSAPGIIDGVRREVERIAARLGGPTMFSIGNSMGGFGAFLFTRYFDIRSAIAFSPQVTMDDHVYREMRWRRFRPAFGDQPVSTLNETISDGTRYYALFGEDDAADAAQRAILEPHDALSVRVLPGAGHDLAAALKAQQLLQPAIAAMFDADDALLSALLAPIERAEA